MADKCRQVLRLSIVFFFSLAVFFFLMIFLLGLARKWDLKNKVEAQVPIQQAQNHTWGRIPGELHYNWTRSYNLYQFDYKITDGASDIALSTRGNYSYEMKRDFENPTWYPQKSVV